MGQPIKSTGQVLHVLSELLVRIAKWGHTVSFIRADNGATFRSVAFKQLCATHDIELSFSAPYSPHQNALAERPWRTLAEMARCLLSTAGLPRSYWEFGFKHAIFIHNRTYRTGVDGIPITLALDIVPDLSTTKIFGCKSYVHVDAALRRKLDDKAWEGVFVGNSPDSPAWLIYNPTTKRTVASRSVIFDECELLSAHFPDHVHDTGSILPFQEPTDLAEVIYKGRTKTARHSPRHAADSDSDEDHPGDSAPTIMDSSLTPETLRQDAVVAWEATPTPAPPPDSASPDDLNLAGQHMTDDHLQMHWATVLLAEAPGLPRESTTSVMTLLQHGPWSSGDEFNFSRDDQPLPEDIPYSNLVGCLLWTAVCTRPDIAATVSFLCRFVSKPQLCHWTAAKRVLRYLGPASDGDSPLQISPISWRSALQSVVAQSTCEAEYIAVASVSQEILFLRQLLTNLGCPPTICRGTWLPSILFGWFTSQLLTIVPTSSRNLFLQLQHTAWYPDS
mmetsp:Transcript_12208/g.21920  ORF Transcript_12208/g.21920 Transcript_12208/m.21920 type:complete len:504 (-) Transcript_12208:653-2164(-)